MSDIKCQAAACSDIKCPDIQQWILEGNNNLNNKMIVERSKKFALFFAKFRHLVDLDLVDLVEWIKSQRKRTPIKNITIRNPINPPLSQAFIKMLTELNYINFILSRQLCFLLEHFQVLLRR